MKITSITRQVKRDDRFSVFIDGKYALSLSESGLLETKLCLNQELNQAELKRLKLKSSDDKLYAQTLRLVATRPKTRWEVEIYLKQKGARPDLIEQILNKLSKIDLINDSKRAKSLASHYTELKPISKRKLVSQLKKRRLSDEDIDNALSSTNIDDRKALEEIVGRKRAQVKYQDKTKFMRYLANQGFNYEDIKAALSQDHQD